MRSIKDHSSESKAFSKSIKSSKPGMLFSEAYFIILSISLMFSPINLPFRKPVWSLFISFRITVFIRFAIAFAAILKSQLRRVSGRQFLMKCRSVSFFGISLIIPRLCVIESVPVL